MSTSSTPGGVVAADDLRIGTGGTRRFVGAEHDAGVSYFFVENQPGEGPGLHWHPYSETWVVLEGTVRIRRGDDVVTATAGDTATVAPYVVHGFTNAGEGTLRILCIHASPEIIQTFID